MYLQDAVTMPAQLFAAQHQAAPEFDTTTEYLAFRLGTQEYGVDIMKVQEIRNYENPVRMAGATASTPGLLSLRGEIITVLDLRARFGLPCSIDENTVTIVLNLSCGTVGLIVDAVSDVVEFELEQIHPVHISTDTPNARLFQGLGCTGEHGERTLILMNFNNLPACVATHQ